MRGVFLESGPIFNNSWLICVTLYKFVGISHATVKILKKHQLRIF